MSCRTCPECGSRVKNIYQHARDVHRSSYRKLCSKEDHTLVGGDLTEDSAAAVEEFSAWLLTVDGGKLAPKTVGTYHTCTVKALKRACNGDLARISEFEEWSAPGGFLDQLMDELTPSTVGSYLHALTAFVGFLGKKRSRAYHQKFVHDAQTTFHRWSLSLRDSKKEQKMKRVAQTQVVVPGVAKNMKNYETSQQYR